MKTDVVMRMAMWLVERRSAGSAGEAFAGDLLETFANGRSRWWCFAQALRRVASFAELRLGACCCRCGIASLRVPAPAVAPLVCAFGHAPAHGFSQQHSVAGLSCSGDHRRSATCGPLRVDGRLRIPAPAAADVAAHGSGQNTALALRWLQHGLRRDDARMRGVPMRPRMAGLLRSRRPRTAGTRGRSRGCERRARLWRTLRCTSTRQHGRMRHSGS